MDSNKHNIALGDPDTASCGPAVAADPAVIKVFATNHLNKQRLEADKAANFQTDLWELCTRQGILGWTLPEAYGGASHSCLYTCELLEALGHGCRSNGLLFCLGTQLWGLQKAILQFGSEDQKAHYLPTMVSKGKIGCFAINEPESGSDATSLTTTARKEGTDFILNGEKSLISMAPVADFALVFASSNPEAGRWGVSAFLVDRDTPGIKMHPPVEMMGLRSAPVGGITLENCRVPAENLLGKEGSGATLFNYAQIWERSLLLAPQIGSMQRQLEECVRFAKSRKRGGVAIGKHQAVSNRIADMAIRLETSRLLQQKAATLLDSEKFDVYQAALTKTHISEAFESNSRDLLAVMGGSGYLSEHGIENDLRDAIGSTIYGGTTDVQRNIISGILGL